MLIVIPPVKVRLFPPVIICSDALSKVTAFSTVRFGEDTVKAKFAKFRLVIEMLVCRVELPPMVKLAGPVTVAAPKSIRPPLVRINVVPDKLNMPLDIEKPAGMVTVPPLLVI